MRRILPTVMILLLFLGGASAEEKRQLIPGTTVSMVLPEGLHPAGHGVNGLINATTHFGVAVVEIPADKYELFAADDDVERLNRLYANVPMVVDDADFMTLAGHDALLMRERSPINGIRFRKWVAMIHAKTTIVVNIQAPESQAPDDATVMAMLQSLEIGAERTIADQVALLPYTLAELGRFRPAIVLGGTTLFLTTGEKDPEQQSFLIVTYSPTPAPANLSRLAFARKLITDRKSYRVGRLISDTEGGALGPDAVEVVVEAQDAKSGAAINVLQWVQFFPDGYLLVQGGAPREKWDDVVDDMRVVYGGIARKQSASR